MEENEVDDEQLERVANTAGESGEADASKLRVLDDAPGLVVEVPKGAQPPAAVTMAEVEQSASLTDRMLLEVRMRRRVQDENEGFFRDYPDGTAGRRHNGPSAAMDRSGVLAAKSALELAMKAAKPSWRHKLELAMAEACAEGDERKLRGRLLDVAAVAIAWAEGIEVRASDRRVQAQQNALKLVVDKHGVRKYVPVRPWWQRVLAKVGLLR